MAAYLIAHRRDILDPERLKAYREGIDASIARFGGRVLARADGFKVLEGNWHPGSDKSDAQPERVTVIEFPDLDRVTAWYQSPDYARLKEIRQHSAASDIVAVEGL